MKKITKIILVVMWLLCLTFCFIEIKNKTNNNNNNNVRVVVENLTTEDMVNLAHDEDYKLGAEILKNNLTEILDRQDKIELTELTLLGLDKITAFISLLFLVQEGEYSIEHTDFYGDIYVVKKTQTQDDEDDEFTEEITNEMIVKSAVTDDVSDIVDNVVNLHDNIKVEEYNK